MYFRGKKHARAAYKRLRHLDNRPEAARRFVRDAVEAEREYERLVGENTQQTIKRDKAAERVEKAERRRQTTLTLGRALEETGLMVFFADTIQEAIRGGRPYRPPVSMHFPGDEPGTEIVHRVTNVRRVNFFPEHAAIKHARMERELAAFVQDELKRGQLISMMTFNAGTRWRDGAETGRLKEGREELRGALARLFRLKSFQRFFEAIFIGEENGTPKGRYSRRDGRWRWHLHTHAHVLVRARERAEDFNRLMTWVRLRYHAILTGKKYPGLIRLLDFAKPLSEPFAAQVGRWMKETQARALVEYDGKIRDVQEACKYPMKDKDLAALYADGGAQPIRDLYDNLFRARLITPRGSFREWRKAKINEPGGCRRKVIVVKTPGGDSTYRIIKDWNGQTPDMAEAVSERKKRAAERESLARLKQMETNRLRGILKSRLAEWGRFPENGAEWGRFPEKPGGGYIKSFPRNDFRIDGFCYRDHSPVVCLKREIIRLFELLMGSAILFDVGIPGFVLEAWRRFPAHVVDRHAMMFEQRHPEDRPRRPLRNFVVARLAPTFLAGGTIARPGLVVIGDSGDGRVWRNDPLARRLERIARPHIAAAVELRDAEAALPDCAPPVAEDAPCAYNARACAADTGSPQTPLIFPFSTCGPPGNEPENAELPALAGA
jgi:hypothetical protein